MCLPAATNGAAVYKFTAKWCGPCKVSASTQALALLALLPLLACWPPAAEAGLTGCRPVPAPQMMAPLYEKLSSELHPHVRFYTIDIDSEELGQAVQQNKVVGVPNFSFYLGGEKVGSFRGAKKDQLLGTLEQLQAAQQAQQQLADQSGAEGLLLA
jgi:thiol-disulfide isomerase/thioredoxin